MTIDPDYFADRLLRQPDDSLGFVLWRATHAWQRYLEQVLAPTGLTHLRWALLVALAWLNKGSEPISQRRLADFLSMHPMQVSQVLTGMEKAGLVAREPSSADRRILVLSLTESGETTLRTAMPLVEEAHRRFFEKADAQPDDLRALLLDLLR